MVKAKNKSFIDGNKKKNFNNKPEYARWTGTSINFRGPELEKIKIKLSKDHHKEIESGIPRRTIVSDFFLNDENEVLKRVDKIAEAKKGRYLQVDSYRYVGLAQSPQRTTSEMRRTNPSRLSPIKNN